MPLLPAHLESLRPWLAEAAEVVVVDSNSQDGTEEFLRSNLHHPRLRFFTHPPGLYQSWNFGIAQIEAPFAYISAVGDSITGDGLAHLHDVAGRLQCDAVVSRPNFLDAAGQPTRAPHWPIDDICETLAVKEPLVVAGLPLLVFALSNLTGALLGSSASNLYRTICLQRFPFRTDFGTSGDGAWGLEHALDIRLGVTPRIISDVRDHPKTYNVREYSVSDLPRRYLGLAVEALRQHRAADPVLDRQCRSTGVETLLAAVADQLEAQRELEQAREFPLPWVLNPRAWQTRSRRGTILRKIQQLKFECLTRSGAMPVG